MAIQVKMGLLWEAEKFFTDGHFLSLITITKIDGKTSYRSESFTNEALDRLDASWSAQTLQVLYRLSQDANSHFFSALFSQRKKIGGGRDQDTFFHHAAEKHYHEQVQTITNYLPKFPFYHKVLNPETGRNITERCYLENEQPQISFEIVSKKNQLEVSTLVHLENTQANLKKFQRVGFMLRKVNKWYSLSLKDARMLNWLEETDLSKYNKEPEVFADKVLRKLEEHHKVNRNGLFQMNEIKTIPENEILFTELSGNFLMLTPRWNYDGFIVEGNWKEVHKKAQQGKEYLIYRDEEKENNFLSYIESLHPDFPGQATRGYYYLSFANARKRQWFIKTYRQLLEKNVSISGLDMLVHFRYSPFEAETNIALLKQTKTSLDMEVKVFFGKEEVPLLSIQKMLLNNARNVLLKDDSIGFFTDEWLAQYATIFKHGVIYKNRMTLPPWILVNAQEAIQKHSVLHQTIPEDWRRQWMDWQNGTLNIPVPPTINCSLRPYQQKGFEWLVLMAGINAGACLADDMGLGKTLQTISFMAYQHHNFPDGRSIVVCPASLVYNWQQEIRKFAPSLKAFTYRPQQGQNWESYLKSESPVIIVSYHALRNDLEKFSTIQWQVAVIDESQNIKNPTALITKSVYGLQAINRIALSGTPVMNNTFDLYAQLNFLLPGYLGNREFFKKEYANPIDRNADKDKVFALRQLTQPFILRRTKSQVATDLPSKIESILWCEMSEAQKAFYEEVKADIKENVFLGIQNEGFSKSKLNILQGILKLRQVCNSPLLIENDVDYTPCSDSVKINQLIYQLTDLKACGSKALVFSQFTGMLNLIAKKCEEEGIDFYHFDGSTVLEKRRNMVEAFQSNDDATTVFLISLKAGNAGLNLTKAQYVYLVDPWWNRAVEQQAIDRTHRIGQSSNVFAYRMICQGTIEEKIIALQERKHLISDELVTAEEGLVKNMTEEDLKFLFS